MEARPMRTMASGLISLPSCAEYGDRHQQRYDRQMPTPVRYDVAPVTGRKLVNADDGHHQEDQQGQQTGVIHYFMAVHGATDAIGGLLQVSTNACGQSLGATGFARSTSIQYIAPDFFFHE